jgi:microcystin-dependent protein
MADYFIGEIKLFPFTFAPKGWAVCQGQLLSIAQNQALFSLLGTTYGGNGQTTFALPDLRGRVPMHSGNGPVSLGQLSGVENVTLTKSNLPAHTHTIAATSNVGTTQSFAGSTIASCSVDTISFYGPAEAMQPLNPANVANAGGSQPHSNCQPSLVMNFCIATGGVFPSRN